VSGPGWIWLVGAVLSVVVLGAMWLDRPDKKP